MTPARGDLPVYYINLASRSDRREFIETQLAALQIPCRRIDATPVDRISPELATICTDPDTPWRINLPTLACALSHRAAWQALLDSGQPAGLVLEDDVIISPAIAPFLAPDILETVGAPLLRLETWGSKARLASHRTEIAGASQSAAMITTQPGAAAYVISRELARQSLADADSCTMEVDRYLFGRGGRWLLEARIAQATPAPCVQLGNRGDKELPDVGRSDINVTKINLQQSQKAHRSRSRANRRYLSHVARRLLTDPAALLAPPKPVPFAGDS